ncbi:MAG: TRAP transporter small permease [Mesorhizobium sp.]|nr:TRAP transporter small permease [Mesorhizobium sp.]
MRIFLSVLNRIIDATMIIGAAAVALMMLHIAIDVIAKFVFQTPLSGTLEIVSNYYMIVVAFIPLAFAERSNAHISVEVAVENFPSGIKHYLSLFALIFSIAVFAAFAWQGFVEAERARASGTFMIEQNIKILIWPAKYLLPVGAGLMAITQIAKLVIAIRGGQQHASEERFF